MTDVQLRLLNEFLSRAKFRYVGVSGFGAVREYSKSPEIRNQGFIRAYRSYANYLGVIPDGDQIQSPILIEVDNGNLRTRRRQLPRSS